MIQLLRKALALSVLLPLGMVLAASETGAQAIDADYQLHAGDTLEVSVWREEELQREIIVRPDGKFSFPLAGEMQAAGRTPAEIRTEVEQRLKVYIPEPVVTVTVKQVGGNRVYVIGQVKKPGAFVMNPRLNVLQALSLAEGATPFAKLDDILIIRSSGGVQQAIRFRYGKVADGEDLRQNILLESGDVIVVP